MTLELGAIMRERFGAPYAVMHRADLADVLYRACRRFANIDMLFGIRGFDAVNHERGTSIIVDEANGNARSARVHAFIGADGVNSETRTRVLNGPASAYSGYVAWRTTLSADLLNGILAPDRTTLLLAPAITASAIRCRSASSSTSRCSSRRRRRGSIRQIRPRSRPSPGPRCPPRPSTPSSRWRGGNWGYWVCNTIDAPVWSDGGVGLIGDAAHAMLPFQAQGAAMGIEDAAILAPLLMTEPDAASAFRRYEAMRRSRVERVRKLSNSNGFAFHLDWPFTIARDLTIRAQGPRGHLKRLDWLYGFDAAPEPVLPLPDRGESEEP